MKKRWVALAGLVVAAVALVGLGYTMRGSRTEGSTTSIVPLTANFTQLTSLPGIESHPSISPDGKSFVYTGGDADGVDILLQRVGGDRPVNLTEDSSDAVGMPAFSPDGEQIAFASFDEDEDGGIFLMGSMGGSLRRLTDFGFNPAWSPDGRQIAFAEELIYEPRNRNFTSGLWVVDVESGETRKISDGDAVQPTWSPDGQRIAYWASRSENAQRDLFTIGIDGGEPVALMDDRPLDWNPVWSPDGKHLYFSSDRGGVLNLWRLPVNEKNGRATGEPVPITTPSGWVGGISVSGDGSRIVYAAREVRTRVEQAPFDLEERAITGPPQKIYEGSRELRDIHPSPDGEWAARVLTGTQEDICVVRRDGSGFRQLTDDPAKDRGVSWTPDGRIVFHSNRSGTYGAWTVRPDGSGLEALTAGSKHSVWNPRVSPDGTRLAYNNADGAYLLDLRIDSAQRGSVELPPLDGEAGRFWHSHWSPDGKWLLGQDDDSGVVTYSVETGEYRRLTDSGDYSQWIPGTSVVLYQDDDALWTVDSSSGESRPVELGSLDLDFLRWIFVDPETGMLIYLVRQEESDIWMAELE